MIPSPGGITVLDGMATLAGVRPARAAVGRAVPPVEPARRSSGEDRLDLSADARAAARGQRGTTLPQAASASGRLIDVLA